MTSSHTPARSDAARGVKPRANGTRASGANSVARAERTRAENRPAEGTPARSTAGGTTRSTGGRGRPARTEGRPATARTAETRPESPRSEGTRTDGGQGRRSRSRGRGRGRAADTPRTTEQKAPQAPAVDIFAAEQLAPVGDTRSFADLGVPAALLLALAGLGATSPFPIQTATLETTLAGRDVLGRGRTGSGKTIAFAIPLVARLTGGVRKPGVPRGLVLVPTRELALQVERTIAPLAKAARMKTLVVFGGVGYNNQISALRSGVDIVIACPGRLEDLIAQQHVVLSGIEVTVLDEADHMADLGFLPGVRRLLRQTPAGTQRLLFSATLDNGINVLVKDFLNNPSVHAVDGETSRVDTMDHHVFAITKDHRSPVVRELAATGARRLFFTRTKHSARKWARQLTESGIPAVDLHGNLSQNARERNLAAFSTGQARVMVATDIAARGIHVDDIDLVVHLDPPSEHKAYLHRSGRTARAGAGGTVITLMLPEQRKDVQTLMKQAGISPTTSTITPGDPAITAIAGV